MEAVEVKARREDRPDAEKQCVEPNVPRPPLEVCVEGALHQRLLPPRGASWTGFGAPAWGKMTFI